MIPMRRIGRQGVAQAVGLRLLHSGLPVYIVDP